MASHEGLGNFIINEHEIRSTTLDIFSVPEKENTLISGKEVEIRLFTVLERCVIICSCYIRKLENFQNIFLP